MFTCVLVSGCSLILMSADFAAVKTLNILFTQHLEKKARLLPTAVNQSAM